MLQRDVDDDDDDDGNGGNQGNGHRYNDDEDDLMIYPEKLQLSSCDEAKRAHANKLLL